jgi:hypothetical protein
MTKGKVEDWAQVFCGYLGRSAVLSFADGGGPRRRLAAVACR